MRIVFLLIVFYLSLSTSLLAKNYDAVMVSSSQEVQVKGKVLYTTYTYQLQINNRSGEQYAEVSIPYSPMVELVNLEAKVSDSDGRVVKKLKKSDIEVRSAISSISFFEDDFVKEFTLKHNVYPYTISYSYQTRQKEFIHLAHWSPVVYYDIPTYKSKLTLTLPVDYQFNYYQQFCDSASITKIDNDLQYVWEGLYDDLIVYEEYMPHMSNIIPSVSIVPVDFEYDQQGSMKSWESLGAWQCLLLKGLQTLTSKEKGVIENLVRGVYDEKEKVRILYHYLQDETRYVNVTIETGGLKPYPATYVCQTKYGDCKALSNYFRAVLKSIDIDAYYVKVNAGSPTYQVIRDFPSQQSNHIILFVPLENDSLWLDCTSDNAFGYLGTFTQDRDALLIEEGKSRLVRTPAMSCESLRDERHIKVKYQQASPAIVSFDCILRGDLYEDLSSVKRSYQAKELDRVVRNYFNEYGYDIIDYDIVNYDRDSTCIGFNYSASSQKIYKNYGNDLIIRNIPFDLPDMLAVPKRQHLLDIDYPICKKDSIYYEIPLFYTYHGETIKHVEDSKFGNYSITVEVEKGRLLVTREFTLDRGCYPLDEYADFYTFWEKVRSLDAMKILFTK